MVTYAPLATAGLGIVQVLGTVISMPLIERTDRTLLLAIAYACQGVANLVFAATLVVPKLVPHSSGVAIASMIVAVLSFALGGGPVTGVLVPELFPAKIRGEQSIFFPCSECQNTLAFYLPPILMPLDSQAWLWKPFLA